MRAQLRVSTNFLTVPRICYYCLNYMTCVENIFYFYQSGPYSPTVYITPNSPTVGTTVFNVKYSPTVGYKIKQGLNFSHVLTIGGQFSTLTIDQSSVKNDPRVNFANSTGSKLNVKQALLNSVTGFSNNHSVGLSPVFNQLFQQIHTSVPKGTIYTRELSATPIDERFVSICVPRLPFLHL